MASINIKRKGWSFCLSWDSLDRGSNFGSMSAGLSPRTIAHTGKVYSPHRFDIQEKAFRGGAATERQCNLLVAPDVAKAQYGLLRSRAFPIHAALDDVFVAVHGRDVRWISIEIGSTNAILCPVLVDPLPQQLGRDPSFSPCCTLGAHDIGGESVAIAAAPAAAMV